MALDLERHGLANGCVCRRLNASKRMDRRGIRSAVADRGFRVAKPCPRHGRATARVHRAVRTHGA
jgi:hypothetical protein